MDAGRAPCNQPRRVSGDSFDHSWRRIELKLSVRCSMRSPPLATERVMADFSCASTKQTSHWPAPMSWKAPVRFHVILAVAAFALAGCNANQTLNPSSRTAPGVVAGLARLMRENALKARQRRRFKGTTDSLHAFPVAPNLLNQDFNATGPNQKWGADISYVWTREGWLYLAVVIDLFARRVVGWAAGDRLHKELAL